MKRRHHEFAHKLYVALLQRKLTWRRPSEQIDLWAEEFALLEDEDGYEASEIKPVLEWYCSNAGREWVPQAYSGQTFRTKFDRIEAAMDRLPVIEAVADEIERIDNKASDERSVNRKWAKLMKTHDIAIVVIPKGWPDYSKMPVTPRLRRTYLRWLRKPPREEKLERHEKRKSRNR